MGTGTGPVSTPPSWAEKRFTSLPAVTGAETSSADPLPAGRGGRRSGRSRPDTWRTPFASSDPQVDRVRGELTRGAGVTAPQVQWAVEWCLKFAEATGKGSWLDTAFAVWRERGELPSSDQVVTIERLVNSVTAIDLRGFDALLHRWRLASLPRAEFRPPTDAPNRRAVPDDRPRREGPQVILRRAAWVAAACAPIALSQSDPGDSADHHRRRVRRRQGDHHHHGQGRPARGGALRDQHDDSRQAPPRRPSGASSSFRLVIRTAPSR